MNKNGRPINAIRALFEDTSEAVGTGDITTETFRITSNMGLVNGCSLSLIPLDMSDRKRGTADRKENRRE
jgi:hypothetical protein